MSCCKIITINTIYKYTVLDPTDLVEGRDHLFLDLNKFKISEILGDDCLTAFCNELSSGSALSAKWQAIYDNEDFQCGSANWLYWYYLESYSNIKYPDVSTSSVKMKMKGVSQKAEKAFEDLKKWMVKKGTYKSCFTNTNTSCNNQLNNRNHSSNNFSYDII